MDLNLDIPLLPAQKEFVTTYSLYPALVGGLGSGKTEGGIIRPLMLMLREPGINTLYAMPTYDLLRLRAIPGFIDQLTRLRLPFKLNKSEYSIDIFGFGSVYLRSYDNPKRFIAFEVAHSIVDEIDTLVRDKAREVWRKVVERTRQKTKSGINTIGAVTSPDHGKHGFTYEKWGKNPDKDHQLIKAKTTDNKFLPEGYADQIRLNYDDKLASLYLDGEFVNLNQHNVYHFFDKERHALQDKSKADINHIHIGHDFNIGGCCSSVWAIEGKKVYAVSEFVSHDTYDFVNNLNKFKGKQITIYPDATGKSRGTNASLTDIQIISNAGYRVNAPNANPLVRDRINAVNSKLSKDELFVDIDKCPELSDALESQAYDDKGEPEKFKQHPSIDDWNDSGGYFIHRKFPVARPVGFNIPSSS